MAAKLRQGQTSGGTCTSNSIGVCQRTSLACLSFCLSIFPLNGVYEAVFTFVHSSLVIQASSSHLVFPAPARLITPDSSLFPLIAFPCFVSFSHSLRFPRFVHHFQSMSASIFPALNGSIVICMFQIDGRMD